MKAALLVALLACAVAAHAQHAGMHMPPAKGPPQVVTPATDPDRRDQPMVVVPSKGETMDHASMHALPMGTGAALDGGAWLRIDVSGVYTVHNATVICGPDCRKIGADSYAFEGNRVYRVLPHKGPLVWTPPSGKQGKVPDSQLIAPTVR